MIEKIDENYIKEKINVLEKQAKDINKKFEELLNVYLFIGSFTRIGTDINKIIQNEIREYKNILNESKKYVEEIKKDDEPFIPLKQFAEETQICSDGYISTLLIKDDLFFKILQKNNGF